jgi:hypothetical protein
MFLSDIPNTSGTLRVHAIPYPTSFTADGDSMDVDERWLEAVGYKALQYAHEQEADPDYVAKGEYYAAMYERQVTRAKNFVDRAMGQTSPFVPYSNF